MKALVDLSDKEAVHIALAGAGAGGGLARRSALG